MMLICGLDSKFEKEFEKIVTAISAKLNSLAKDLDDELSNEMKGPTSQQLLEGVSNIEGLVKQLYDHLGDN